MKQEKKKSLWGWGIAIFYVCFVIGMLTLVFKTSGNYDLVSEDYYEQSTNYQQTIDALKRTAQLDEMPKIEVVGDELKVSLPKSLKISEVSMQLYSAQSAEEDKVFDYRENVGSELVCDISKMRRGSWDVKMSWRDGAGELYVFNQKVKF